MLNSAHGTPVQDIFSVAVLGAMNPAIHHPLWYRQVLNAIDEVEFDAAMQGEVIVTPPLAQFRTPTLLIQCAGNRWDVQAASIDLFPQMLHLAGTTFNALEHTPVAAFGFNFDVQRTTAQTDVGACIARTLERAPLGLEDAAGLGASFTHFERVGVALSRVIVEPVPNEPAAVTVRINVHHDLKAMGVSGVFDLGVMLDARLPAARDWANARTERIVQALNTQGGT